MQAKKILGCKSSLGEVVQSALKVISAQPVTDETQEQAKPQEPTEPDDPQKQKNLIRELHDNPDRIVQALDSMSVVDAYEAIHALLNSTRWMGCSMDQAKLIRKYVAQVAKNRVVNGSLDDRFTLIFRLYDPTGFFEWLELLDINSLDYLKLDELTDVVLWPRPSGLNEGEYSTDEQRDKAIKPIYNALLSKLYDPRPAKGRRPRPSIDYTQKARPFRLTERHVMYLGVKTPLDKKIISSDGKFFVVKYKDVYDIFDEVRNLRNAQDNAFSLLHDPSFHWSAGDLSRYFFNRPWGPVRMLGDVDGKNLITMLTSCPRGGIVFADIMPEIEKAAQEILDKAVANGTPI